MNNLNNSNNTGNEKQDIIKEIMEVYSDFLDFLDKEFDIGMNDSVKNKNYNLFKTLISIYIGNDIGYLNELKKRFKIIKHAKKGFFDLAIKPNKSNIRSGNYYLLPGFIVYENLIDIKDIYIVEKKDKISEFKEKIKDFLRDLLPQGKWGTN